MCSEAMIFGILCAKNYERFKPVEVTEENLGDTYLEAYDIRG